MKVDPYLTSPGPFSPAYEAGRSVALTFAAAGLMPRFGGIEAVRRRAQLNALSFEILTAQAVYELTRRVECALQKTG